MKQIIDFVGNFKKSFSLLHLVGLRPWVYYTLTNFRGGGKGPLALRSQFANVGGSRSCFPRKF